MRIGLRVFSNTAWMGGIQYVLNIARMLRALADEAPDEIVFLTPTPAAEEIAARHAALADRIAPFQQARALGLDFVYPATQLAEAPFGAPWAGWIPDWQSLHLPDLFNERERARRFIQYRVLARHCAVVVLSSQMALRDTQHMFPDATRPMRVLHFPATFDDEVYTRPADRLARTRAQLGIPERYVLICNQFWVHKNHRVVMQALRHVHGPVHVVMTGELDDKRWPEYAAEIRALLAESAIAGRVTLTEQIDRDLQIDLMLGALGFLQPSKFEGWSTFVEEARALGRPVLLSEFPVHREQAPHGSMFFDPDEPEQLARLLDEWFASPPAALPLSEARLWHQSYVVDCARAFMDIARLARSEFCKETHDPKPIAAAALVENHADVVAQANDLVEYDQAKFEAAVRQLFRDYPEELAGLADIVCGDRYPLHARSYKTVIRATVEKMSPAEQGIFLDKAPASYRLRAG